MLLQFNRAPFNRLAAEAQELITADTTRRVSKTQLISAVDTDRWIVQGQVISADTLRQVTATQSQSFLADTGRLVIEFIKMEVGLGSTLANDPPADYGEQLALCKRFYRLWTTEQARTEALKEVVLMRLESPTFGTINIGGTTYYYANAEL